VVAPVVNDEEERKESLLGTGLLLRFAGQVGICNGAKGADVVREEKGARLRP
jgi:hypothetical protein